MKQIVPIWRRARIRVSMGERLLTLRSGGATGRNRICYTARMFIHRVFITGRSDRGAWPWRKPVCLNT
jgi:hypothetical protein